MLKENCYFTYKNIPIPSFFVIHTFYGFRFKTKNEIKKDLKYILSKIKGIFKKKDERFQNKISVIIKSSFDSEIESKGGIVDNMGNVHTTARSYKNYLKDNGLVIRDWSDGSLKKPQMQLTDRGEIARIINETI